MGQRWKGKEEVRALRSCLLYFSLLLKPGQEKGAVGPGLQESDQENYPFVTENQELDEEEMVTVEVPLTCTLS